MIPISHRNGEVFEKAASGSRAESSWGREKGGWEPMALSEEKLCSVGCKWMYTFNRREAKKLIPARPVSQLVYSGRTDRPQGLKPVSYWPFFGTAEAVP